MDKTTPARIFANVKNAVSKHSPEILIGMGIAGMLTTTVLAVKATPKALQLIEEEKDELGVDKLKPIEVVKATWKCYIPAATTAAASTACLICSSKVSTKRNAALATAYTLSEKAFSEYKEKVIETIGEKKEEAVRDKINEKRVKEHPVTQSEVIITEKGSTLCFDPISKRYFTSDIERIKRIVNEMNKNMIQDLFGYVSLNDFYEELGLESLPACDGLGWNLDNGSGLIDIDYGAQLTDEGKPCIVLNYMVAPRYDYTVTHY